MAVGIRVQSTTFKNSRTEKAQATKASRKAERRAQSAARKAAAPAQQDDLATPASAAMGLQQMTAWTSPRAVGNALLSLAGFIA